MSPSNRCRRTLEILAPSPLAAMARVSAALITLIALGCTLNKDQFRADQELTRIGGQGKILEPKRCLLEVAILTRPFGDKAINASAWDAADAQCVPDEARRVLQANGVKIGKIIGPLPADLESVLRAKPPHKVDPVSYLPETGDPVGIRTAESTPQLSLLMNLDNRAFAKDYEVASGLLRVTANHDGEHGVSLRIVPEIHHGPVKQSFQPMANPGAYPINQMTTKLSQQEDSLSELASTMVLQQGEVAIIGCDAEQDRTLGSFLFTLVEANSDRKMQHLVLIWASRNRSGIIEADKLHVSPDRPKESKHTKSEDAKAPDDRDAAKSSKKDVGPKDGEDPS